MTLTDPTHPMAAGYSGTQTVSSGGNKFSHAYTLGSGAEPVATTSSSTEYVIFAYDTAAQMNSGVAAARRVGFNWTYGTPDTASAVGWDLFDAAVDWAAGTQSGQSGNQPPVVSQITATPAATITLPTDTVTLDAVTSDPDSGPNPLTYNWSVTSAPTGGTVTFGTPTAEDTSATFNIAGSYTLRLTADDSSDTAVGDITITVNPQPPAVSTRVTYSIAGQTVAVADNGTLTWILGDHQGSTSTAITAGQATTIRYNPYGTQRGTPTSALPTDRTYTGQTADPTTGLMYYRSRYYNPAVGQFTQPDTATPPGPPGLNRYSYTNGNPIRFTDPSGHCSTSMILNGCGGPRGKNLPNSQHSCLATGSGCPSISGQRPAPGVLSAESAFTQLQQPGLTLRRAAYLLQVPGVIDLALDNKIVPIPETFVNPCNIGSGLWGPCSQPTGTGYDYRAQLRRWVADDVGPAIFEAIALIEFYIYTDRGAEPLDEAPTGPVVTSNAANAADYAHLLDDLEFRQAASIFDEAGGLRPSVISNSRPIIPGDQLINRRVIDVLTSDGSSIADWAKYSTPTLQGPSGPFQVHFYYDSTAGVANYSIDYKVVFNNGVGG